MIKIKKGQEPKEWTEKKHTPGFTFNAIPELRKALLEEQGYLCAYCTCRISEDNSKIEHIKCRDRYPQLELDYNNMVVCCTGNTKGETHCDTRKGNQDISFDLFSENLYSTISYSSRQGQIKSNSKTFDNEINHVLNLNHKVIQNNRKSTLDGIITLLGRGEWSKSEIQRQVRKYSQRNIDNKYYPHCGIVLWYLNRKLGRM